MIDLRRIWILLAKEARLGATNFMIIFVLVMPVALTLLISLVFGDLFAQTPRLGIYDAGGNDRFTQPLVEHASINTTLFSSDEALQAAVGRGRVEVGLSLPVGFADALAGGADVVTLTSYRWGEAGLRSLLMLDAALARAMVVGTGVEQLVSIDSEQLGRADTATWAQRLLPLLVLMAIVLGGVFVPATSLVQEKEQGTLVALTTTPASLLDVYLTKTIFGVMLSGAMAIVILILNQALGGQWAPLFAVILLGALMNAVIGIIMGSVAKDMDTFMALIKAFGIVLYAPGLLRIFPAIPEWIGRFFPTYYIMNPLLEISQNGAGFGEIFAELAVLALIVAGLLLVLTRVIGYQQKRLALAG